MKVALLYFHAFGPGGYPKDVRWLAGSLSSKGVSVQVVANDGEERDGLSNSTITPVHDLSEAAHHADVLHMLGLFLPAQLRVWRMLRSPAASVVSPLAHLMPEHVRYRSVKKKPYLAAVRAAFAGARRRHVAHLFSSEEEPGARKYLGSSDFFQATAGLFPVESSRPNAQDRHSGDYLLFFGRNDVHQKGLDRLLKGYRSAVDLGLDLHLLIAGKSDRDSGDELRAAIRAYQIERNVEVLGEVSIQERTQLLLETKALVFLSRWDGPPRPIREALAVGTPVIVSRGTNMGELVESHGAGRSPSTMEDLAPCLLQAEDEDIVAQWRDGAEKLRERLSWERVADEYIAGYELAANQ